MINLRNKKEPKKRGRKEIEYQLTLKGLISAYNLNLNPEKDLYSTIKEFAKKYTKKGEIPAIIFDNNEGSFIGVTKHES